MKIAPKKRLKLANKELCMDACLMERNFECRSANWHRQIGECTLSDQDRHSVSQSEAGDQQIKSLHGLYGPAVVAAVPEATNNTANNNKNLSASPNVNIMIAGAGNNNSSRLFAQRQQLLQAGASMYHQNYYMNAGSLLDKSRLNSQLDQSRRLATPTAATLKQQRQLQQQQQKQQKQQVPLEAANSDSNSQGNSSTRTRKALSGHRARQQDWSQVQQQQSYIDIPANAQVDYLENNCIYEPNKLCEFRKIQNRVLKTVDSIYQDVANLEECKQKCLNAPYRCYSFDYGDTSERVCRTSHLDQASLMSVREPYLEVVGAITYELAACFNVSIQCRAKDMVALVSSSKTFKGKIYAKSRPNSCVTDVRESLSFELSMKYNDNACDVRAVSNQQHGVFSNDIIIQHHDRIVTTQDVGLSVYCQYDLGNRSVTNNVDLAIERIPEGPIESKQQNGTNEYQTSATSGNATASTNSGSLLTITGLATTVVRSPNVTMRITNMNGQPVTSATVGDRLALLFEIKEKTNELDELFNRICGSGGHKEP